MSVFLLAFFWGLGVLGALAGWGLWGRGGRTEETPAVTAARWLEAPARGIAVSVVAGGGLNLLAWANSTGAVVFVAAGLAWLVVRVARAGRGPLVARVVAGMNGPTVAGLALVALLLALRFAGSVVVASFHPDPGWSAYRFNPQDDMQSYLVSVERMRQTGTLGADPFNARQMMSGLGGEHFLNALTLAWLPWDHAHLLEGGIGLAAWCMAAAGVGLRLGLGRRAAAALALVPLAVELGSLNLTSVATAAAVLTALAADFLAGENHGVAGPARRAEVWRGRLGAGVLLAGACALKSTVIPGAVAFVAAMAAGRAWKARRGGPLADGAWVGLIAGGALLPWMVWQHHSSGTFLYPLLGRGGQAEVYFPSSPAAPSPATLDMLYDGLIFPGTLLAGALLALAGRKIRRAAGAETTVALAALAAWIADWVAVARATEIPSAYRYAAPARDVALVLVAAAVWRVGRRLAADGPRAARWAGPVALAALLAGLGPEWSPIYGQILPRDLRTSARGALADWVPAATRARHAQSAIPPGAPFLAYLTDPFLLDFTRNPIAVVDWPGEASPPPGLPVNAGGEAVAAYLRARGLRYVAYAYRAQANFPRGQYGNYLYFDQGRVIHREAANAFAFQDDLASLGKKYQRIFDDGEVFVLDLQAPE